jgi:DUF971 family protein
MKPVKIKVVDKNILYILWDDKSESNIPLKLLREKCPCANCLKDRENKSSTYIPLLSSAELTLTDIKPVGKYAIQFYWKDGHHDGIYMFELLKGLEKEKLID